SYTLPWRPRAIFRSSNLQKWLLIGKKGILAIPFLAHGKKQKKPWIFQPWQIPSFTACAFKDKSQLVALGTSFGKVHLYSLKNRKILSSFQALNMPIQALTFRKRELFGLGLTKKETVFFAYSLEQKEIQEIQKPFPPSPVEAHPVAGTFAWESNLVFWAFSNGRLGYHEISSHKENWGPFFGHKTVKLQWSRHHSSLFCQGNPPLLWQLSKNPFFPSVYDHPCIYSPSTNRVFWYNPYQKSLFSSHLGSKVSEKLLTLPFRKIQLQWEETTEKLALVSSKGFQILDWKEQKQSPFFAIPLSSSFRFSPSLKWLAIYHFSPFHITLHSSPFQNKDFSFKLYSPSSFFNFLSDDLFLYHDGAAQLVLFDLRLGDEVQRYYGVLEESIFIEKGGKAFVFQDLKRKTFLSKREGGILLLSPKPASLAAFSSNRLAISLDDRILVYSRHPFHKLISLPHPPRSHPLAMVFSHKEKALTASYSNGVILVWRIP
ncbi:MAG: hypothetical protein D6785_01315, partial [Planctomycetota bacterium]